MTPDHGLRALAYVEAVWADDPDAMRALARSERGQPGIEQLVSQLSQDTIRLTTLAQAGWTEGMDPAAEAAIGEQLRADGAARMAHLLSDTLELWAQHARPDAAPGLARVLIGYLMTLSPAVTEQDVPQLLEQLRSGLIHRAAAD